MIDHVKLEGAPAVGALREPAVERDVGVRLSGIARTHRSPAVILAASMRISALAGAIQTISAAKTGNTLPYRRDRHMAGPAFFISATCRSFADSQ